MSRDLVCVTEETRLDRVADFFRVHGFKTLPVIDNDGRFRGLISQNDLIQRARADALLRRDRFSSALLGMLENVGGGALARDVMTAETSIVAPEDGIGILVQLLSDSGVQAAPVLSDGRIIGIVTRSDLLAVLARRTILAGLMQRAA